MSTDFIDTFKQTTVALASDLLNTELSEQAELTCSILELEDKIIVSIALNGETDISYDLQLNNVSKKSVVDYRSSRHDVENEDEEVYGEDELYDSQEMRSQIVPVVLIGDSGNLKSQVMASQVGQWLNQFTQKNVILNSSGKIWRVKDVIAAKDAKKRNLDFEKLLIVLDLVKSCYNSR